MSTQAACALILASLSAGTAAAATPLCADGPFREFDFWVGEWDVRDAEGKTAGVNRIASEENGCVLVERWNSAAGGHGQSYNYYDPAAGKWKQLWVGLGILLHMEGGLIDGSMRLEGPLQYPRKGAGPRCAGPGRRCRTGACASTSRSPRTPASPGRPGSTGTTRAARRPEAGR
jgi:hypothetical protein